MFCPQISDTSSGVTGFMFKVEHEYDQADVANQERELDSETWSRVVKKIGNIDLLLPGALLRMWAKVFQACSSLV